MSNGKGKERASRVEGAEEVGPDENSQSTSTSLLGRVTTSAVGLARSTLRSPNVGELDHISSLSAAAGKFQAPSNNGVASSSEGSQTSQRQSMFTSSNHDAATSQFRTHTEAHVLSAEAEFSSFLDGTNTLAPSTDSILEDAAKETKGDVIQLPLGKLNNTLTSSTVAEQEASDGQEVVALLSQSETIPDLEIPDDGENVEWKLSEEQTLLLQALLRDFPPPEPVRNLPVNNPLNFLAQPSFFDDSDAGSGLHSGLSEARNLWVKQWEDVLTRYTDDVWGDLSPLVHQAQEELDELKRDPKVNPEIQPTALRRLGLILGHVRRS